MKIVVLDGYTLNPGDLSWDLLKQLGDVTIYDRTPEDKIVERIGSAEIVFTNKTPINSQTIESTQIKYIGVLATGYNVVDVEAAKQSGIIVTNIPTYGTDAVAQFTIALLLELCHHVGAHSDSVFRGEWEKSQDFCYWNYPLIELAGKTFGIIGFGKIGQAVGRIASALQLKVIYYDQQPVDNCSYATYVSLDELLKESDIISLHCPLFESTKEIINANSIEKMKQGVMIINTSRGPLIDEQALFEGLSNYKIAGAAMDVVSTEPIESTNPLLKAPNCIITPHIAWATKEARIRLMNIAVENLKAYQNGKPIHVVNL